MSIRLTIQGETVPTNWAAVRASLLPLSNSCPDVNQLCPACHRPADWRQYDNGSRVLLCVCGRVSVDDTNKNRKWEYKP